MKINVIRAGRHPKTGRDLPAGEIDLPDDEAKILVDAGLAVPVDEEDNE